MKNITYIKGDATSPDIDGKKILVHCCNNLGYFNAGIAKTIRNKWPKVYDDYKYWSKQEDFKLGNVQFVKVAEDLVICNMIGQEGIGFAKGQPPVRYEAFNEGFKKVAEAALKNKAVVCMPYKIGCGLAGGDWNKIEFLIVKNFCAKDIEVYVYEL